MAEQDVTEEGKGPETVEVNPNPIADPVTAKLQELGATAEVIGKIKDLGADTVNDLYRLTEAHLASVGMKPLKALDLLEALASEKRSQEPSRISIVDTEAPVVASMLQQLPGDDALLSSLKVGGVLKVEHARVVMAGRCLWARQTGIYGADKRLMDMINRHYTDALQQPNPKIFWDLNKARQRNRFAAIFNNLDMPGAGIYATQAARNAFWERMNEVFIPSVQEFQRQLTVWYELWLKQAQANIGINIGAALNVGQGAGVVPRQRMPLINHIIAAIDAMVEAANKVFAGQNEVVAIALGVDAQRLRDLLKNDDLYHYTGSASREIMLRELGLAVTTDVTMMENDFSMFLHNALRVQGLPTIGATTAIFLQELQEIGENIDWGRLGKKIEVKSGGLSGIGAGRGRASDGDDTLPDDEELWK